MNKSTLIPNLSPWNTIRLNLMENTTGGKHTELVRVFHHNSMNVFIKIILRGSLICGSINCFGVTKAVNQYIDILFFDFLYISFSTIISQFGSTGDLEFLLIFLKLSFNYSE